MLLSFYVFFFTPTAPTLIYTLSLHDALPISRRVPRRWIRPSEPEDFVIVVETHHLFIDEKVVRLDDDHEIDRKSTRLNSSHTVISYAVFCLKKKKKKKQKKLERTNKKEENAQ